MLQNMLKTALATAAFGIVHSTLASHQAKQVAGLLFGRRVRNGLYRPFYLVQSIATTSVLTVYVRRLPDCELYRIRGPMVLLMRGGQVAGLAYAAWAASEVGLGRLTGLEGLTALCEGKTEVPPEFEAQGPAPGLHAMQATGPFRHVRHPLNLSPLPVLWLQPRMTANLLAFNLVATAYLALGSKHEELRLRSAYGRAYEDYQHSGVPFYLPAGHGLEPLEDGDRQRLPGVHEPSIRGSSSKATERMGT